MVIVFDPYVAGLSGDMILCALIDLGANKEKILAGINSSEKFLKNSTIKKLEFLKIKKHGIEALSLVLDVDEQVQERKGSEIKDAVVNSVNALNLSKKAKNFAESCIESLISAESKIHGIPPESVHFHEASSIDTLVDIVGVTIAADDLGIFDDEIVCMPICVGGGTVSFSHGIMSNPASAILEIFKNSSLQIHGKSVSEELTTPTGACIVANLSSKPIEYYPLMKIEEIGYGSGKNDFEDFANVLKIVKGTRRNLNSDSVIIIETNVDDVPGEILGNLTEKIMNNNAKDVFISSGITKKGRPTNVISIICDDDTLEQNIDTLVIETGTLGVRIRRSERVIVPREIFEKNLTICEKEFSVKYKVSNFKGQHIAKIEFDDLKRISDVLNKPIREIDSLIRQELFQKDDF